MARKSFKAKEPARLRFNELANGNKSIYLDIYLNGKRQREYLRLYLVPERTPADRLQNEQTMRAANAIKSQRIIDVANDAAGIFSTKGKKVLLADWILNYPRTQAQQSPKLQVLDNAIARIVQMYAGKDICLADVDRDFCIGLINYLTDKYIGRTGKNLTAAAAYAYYARFVCALNAAVRKGLINTNPCNLLSSSDKIKVPQSQRSYLTQEELLRFAAATPDCANRYVQGVNTTKQAFLFSCFCGLRISDIRRLEWGNITAAADGQMRIEIRMQKTKELLYIPLSKQALEYMPERGSSATNAKVFANLQTHECINEHVSRLAAAAGIEKHVTFHTARHTFATLLLTKGADLYTTSKLLGHTNISTTQIYAKIVDEKKQEAVSLLDNLL